MCRQTENIKKAKNVLHESDIKIVFNHFCIDVEHNIVFYSTMDVFIYLTKKVLKFLSYCFISPLLLFALIVFCVAYIPLYISSYILDKLNKGDWFFGIIKDVIYFFKNKSKFKIGKKG